MTTVQEIKAAIDKLTPEQRAELERLLNEADDEWDRQMVADARAGKLDPLVAKVDADIASGNLRDFP